MKITVGDKVKITNKGRRYSTYTAMYLAMREEYPKAKPFPTRIKDEELDRRNDEIIGIVRCVKKHLVFEDTLALVEIEGYSFLFNVKALEVIPYTIDDFEVGDVIEAIDDYYGVTNKENNFIGKVASKIDNFINVKVISCENAFVDAPFSSLCPQHFKFHNNKGTISYIKTKEINIFELFDK